MNRFVPILIACLVLCGNLFGREFTVLVYNVENLFDIDGVSRFEDYRQPPEGHYGPEELLNKMANIRRTLEAVNDGQGPELILFQEFELDLTPLGSPAAMDFLSATRGQALDILLREESWVAALPVELLLLKHLEDHGLTGYQITKPDSYRMEDHTPHNNVVFSRFPIKFVRQRDLRDARDLQVVGLDVDGRTFVVLNNHWKSGASNADTEPIRVQNALVVRAELEAILLEDPDADVIIAGDLNCYYNHKAVFGDRFEETGVNDILPTHGDEKRMAGPEASGLYNLWFELPKKERGSEVYRGYWGTLMQILLAPGLYDNKGIQYVDNSFERLTMPGENVDARWGRPMRWNNVGGGVGYSDHLPLVARFRVLDEDTDGWMSLENPTRESFTDDRPRMDFRVRDRRAVPDAEGLANLGERDRATLLGELFRLDTVLVSERPARVRIGDLEMQIYAPMREIRNRLDELSVGDSLKTYATLETYRGRFQFVIHDPGWILKD